MGLFDAIAGQLGGALSGSQPGNKGGLMEVVMSLINSPQVGGVQGLLEAFRQKGLGDAVSSWVGTGQNLPVSGDQIHAVLGQEQLQSIAQQAGLSPAEASNGLASLLPQLIDRLSPNGQLPEGGMLEQGLALLRGLK